MRILFLAAFSLALAGCASTGPTIDNAQLTELQKGKTTADDIVRRFGKPSFNSDNLDGTRTTAYLQEGTRSNTSAMVTLVAAVASGPGSNANVNAIIFRFDSKGLLSNYERTSESQSAATASSPAAAPAAAASSATAPAAASSSAAAPTAAAAGAAVPAGASTVSPAQAAATRAAPPPKPAPRRADGLPDWLPSGNYDPRNPF